MRILFVGSTYLLKINRQKLWHLANLDNIELFVVAPYKWSHFLKEYTVEPETDAPYTFYPTKTLFEGHESRYIYFPDLTMHIRHIKPDIIHVEQGAQALCYSQAILNKKLFAPSARCIFFTWWNLPDYEFKFYWTLIENFNIKNTDYIIAGNQDAMSLLREQGVTKPIKILPQLGVDTDIYKPFAVDELKEKLELDGFTIGFVGRFVERKGLTTLVEAFAQMSRPAILLFIGRGEQKEELIELAISLDIEDSIRFVDTVPHSEVPAYMNCLDVLVLPSRTMPYWKEQFGHVLIEAMACETPVVGSSSGEIPNVIGEAGLVFREGDVDDLAQKLTALMENPSLRTELARKGRRRVLDHYTHKSIARQIYQIYQELLYE